MARLLHHRFHISRGSVVQLVLPNNSEMYFTVLGTWILQVACTGYCR